MADGDAWVAVWDVSWVMGQICAMLGSTKKSQGLKYECDNLSDGRHRSKRFVRGVRTQESSLFQR